MRIYFYFNGNIFDSNGAVGVDELFVKKNLVSSIYLDYHLAGYAFVDNQYTNIKLTSNQNCQLENYGLCYKSLTLENITWSLNNENTFIFFTFVKYIYTWFNC